jgi:hypothetical protein
MRLHSDRYMTRNAQTLLSVAKKRLSRSQTRSSQTISAKLARPPRPALLTGMVSLAWICDTQAKLGGNPDKRS